MGPRRTVPIEATAYSSDWRSCGWEWGLALGPLPLYLPLCAGRRPSGTVAWPLVPRRRREKVEDKPSLVLGGVTLAVLGAFGVAAHAVVSAASGGGKRWRRKAAKALRDGELGAKMTTAACAGALLGATQFPIGRYWGESHIAGCQYHGVTAMGTWPEEVRPVLWRHDVLKDPVGFVTRLVTLRWGAADGTVAADTGHYPRGTRMHVPGYGWGVVEDRGVDIKGPHRIDLYYGRRRRALQFGRQQLDVTVEDA